MFVLSLRANRLKHVVVPLFFALCLLAVAFVFDKDKTEPVVGHTDTLNYRASTAKERMAFIAQFGWTVSEEPSEVREIVIPSEFDDVYTNYNEIQINQGFDLTDYRGKRVKRWTYAVTNYPGTEGDSADVIRINLLVFDGLVIGGDVCSLKLDGFMHGFSKPKEIEQTEQTTSLP